MSERLLKSMRLRTKQEYRRMSFHAKRLIGRWVMVDLKNNFTQNTRLGITVSKRFGKSHERNRFKRIVREAFRLCYSKLAKEGVDLNIRPRTLAHTASTADIQTELLSFFLR